MNVFINELHYDNVGGDTGEFIEIGGEADANLDGFSLVLYNGNGGASYATVALDGLLNDDGNGFGARQFGAVGLQNGSPDGIALVDPQGIVLEFLSYEGSFTATNGPAVGLTSTDIGVMEDGTEPVGQSLQRTGTGTEATDFQWTGPSDATPGAANAGQVYVPAGDGTPGDGDGEGDTPGMIAASRSTSITLAGAEIVAYDAGTKNYFVTSSAGLQIVDGSDPFNDIANDGVDGLQLITTIDPTGLINPATGVVFDSSAFTSVSIAGGIVAAALPAADKTSDGSILFFDPQTGDFLGAVTVGALPDSVAVSADGAYVVVANEGESSGDTNQPDAAINPNGSVSIIAVNAAAPSDSVVSTYDFTDGSITAEALRALGARVNDNAPSVAADIEPEFVTIEGSRAVITLQENNAVAVIDDITTFSGFTISDIQGLGYKNHSLPDNSLDTSDEDGGIDFHPANVNGIYMPDGVATYTVGGETYTVLANEGDDRDVDTSRVKDLILDPKAFPGAAALQADDALGRLTVSTVDGDPDGDGDYDALFSFGARSFSIRDSSGNLVFDSGDMLDKIAAELGIYDDGRSDNKGTEPESVEIGMIGDRAVAFINLERADATLAFDITDPRDAVYIGQFVNPGDDAPEGLTFIPAGDSATQSNLLAVANEDSGTLTVYDLGDGNGPAPAPEVTLISDVQGDGAASSLVGQTVTIEAIVVGDFQNGDADTGRTLGGFYLQEEDADADGNASTSEGLFVFDANFGADVAIGDKVRVTGVVGEYFGETQLASISSVEVLEQGVALPSAAIIDLPSSGTTLSQNGAVQPDLEAYEGMRVIVNETLTITEQFQLDRFNEIKLFDTDGFEQAGPGGTIITGDRPFQYTQFNDPDAAGNAAYLQQTGARTITYDDGLNEQNVSPNNLDGFQGYNTATAPRMGDTITGLSGILDYKFAGNSTSGSTWRVRATEDGENSFDAANPRPATDVSVDGNLKIASFNVLNFFTTLDQFPDTGGDDVGPAQDQEPRGADTSPQDALDGFTPTQEYDRQLSKLVAAIKGLDADVLGLIELENDFLDGGTSPGDQSAQGDRGIAIAALVNALNDELGAGTYDYVRPGDEFVGSDAIAVGVIYKPGSVQIAAGTSPAFLTDADVDQSILDRSTEDNNGDAAGGSVFDGPNTSRSPLAVTFTEVGGDQQDITVVVNHFKSKGGSGNDGDADAGDGAGNYNNMRLLAAEALDAWLKTNPTGSDTTNQLLLGDFNAYAEEDPIDFLTGEGGFVDVAGSLLDSAYSYLFDGLLGTLDYAFASMDLFSQIVDALEYHINADEADALDYNLEFGRDPGIFDGTVPYRASDHDPVLVGLNLQADDPMPEQNFTLELLHFSDQEGSTNAIADAPNLSAVLNALRAQDLGNDGVIDNTLTISSGDLFIPGVFANASAALYGSAGIADIQIQNELGIQASALGNHDFDFGTAALAGLISGTAGQSATDPMSGMILGQDFAGTAFPYLSTNLDFSTDPNLAPLAVAGGQAPQGNVITSSVIIDVNGEDIGVVGATTPILASISSTGGVGVSPADFDNIPTPQQLDTLAAEIQMEVDALIAANPGLDKIILSAHMQQISIEQALATRLHDVDIIIAGGSNTRLFDDDDRVRDGDSDQGQYPFFTTDADGNPIAVVNTDGSYKYVGRLAIEFDADGHIVVDSYDASVSGAYATDDQGVADLGAQDLVDPEIQQIVDQLEGQIIATESNVFGFSDVFLNGERTGTGSATDPDGVRTQETNLGDLTSDANLVYANQFAADLGESEPVLVSIKNGGGVRASIGQNTVPTGGTEAVRSANEALLDGDGNIIKPAGGISQTDIQSALAFNNSLSLVTLTRAQLVTVLEFGVSNLGGGPFPQIGGVELSFDPSAPAGNKIENAAIVDANGDAITNLVVDGEIAGDPNETFRIVTLSFLVDGGDGYPFPTFDGLDRVDLNDLDGDGIADGISTGDATFAQDGTEQDAFAEFLDDNYRDTPYAIEDQGPAGDVRIENLSLRDDVVSLVGGDTGGDGNMILGTEGDDNLTGTPMADRIDGLGGDDRIDGRESDDALFGGEGDDTIVGGEGNDAIDGGAGDDALRGNAGDDSIFGGSGSDLLLGDAGNDRLDGGEDNDRIDGGEGDDILIGGAGQDEIYGGAGNDVIDALDPTPQADFVDAGDGDDVISGGRLDQLMGGAGNDRAIIDFSKTGSTTAAPVVILNDGMGILQANDGTRLQGFETVEFTLTDGDDAVSTGDVAAVIRALGGNDTIITGSGFDTIEGGDGDDRINAGRGNDMIDGGAGNDTLYGGGGLDTIGGGQGNDMLFGEGGNDRLSGGEGTDVIDGGAGNDRIFGGAGNDSLIGGGGDDTLDGGDGLDTAEFEGTADGYAFARAGDGTITITDTDIAGFNDGTDALTGIENLRFGGIDYLVGVEGTDGNDILFGTDGSDVLSAGNGNDILVGQGGDDDLFGGAGDDLILAGDGDDFADGGSGNDTLIGGAGDNQLRGGSGDDVLIGGAGDDDLNGGSGSDRIELGGGSDVVDGGSGIDTVVLGGAIADYQGSRGFATFELTSEGQTASLRGVERLVFDDGEVDLTDGGDAFDSLFGSMGDEGTGGGSPFTFPGSGSFGSAFTASASELFDFANAGSQGDALTVPSNAAFESFAQHYAQQDPFDGFNA